MSETQHEVDEALLSGYVDGELTQGDEQRVRVHLAKCAACKLTTEELLELRKATMNTNFQVPKDTQWDETPRGGLSRFFHNFGWLIAGVWLIAMVAYAAWQITTDSESIQLESVLGFGVLLALGMIIVSALIDRLKISKTDPYRKVQK